MTRKELTTMTGSVEQTDFAIEILLKHVKRDFVCSVIRAEAAEINEQLNALEAEGWVWRANGFRNASWSKAEKLNGWDLTPEQEAAYDEAYRKCSEVEALLYQYNRVTSLLAVR